MLTSLLPSFCALKASLTQSFTSKSSSKNFEKSWKRKTAMMSIRYQTLWFLRYSLDKNLKVKITMARSKIKSRSHHDIAHLHPLNKCPYQVSTSYTSQFLRYSTDKIFKPRVNTVRSKVKSRSHHNVAQLHPLANVLTKF